MFLASMMMTLAAVPASNPGTWVRTDDYPKTALQQEMEGTVAFRLSVEKDGRVGKCEITQSSGHAVLDEATCALLVERAQFVPGKPVATYASRVSWRIPKRPKLPLETNGFSASGKFANGKLVGECVDQVIGNPPELIPLCDIFEADGQINALNFIDFSTVSEAHLRLLIARAGSTHDDPPGASTGLQRRQLVSASFEVDSSGRVLNCRILKNVDGSDLGDLCAQFDPEEPEFDVSTASVFPVQMMFTMDFLTK